VRGDRIKGNHLLCALCVFAVNKEFVSVFLKNTTKSLSGRRDRTVDQKHIIREIVQFVRSYGEKKSIVTKWKKPLVGFASADDPLFSKLKEVVRPSHALPRELLPSARTVVAFFIPFENALQKENDQAGFYPARSWAVAYVETNRLISELAEYVKNLLEAGGSRAVFAPPTHNYDPAVLMSDWSHRHIAFVAGLGRFGLNRWLITEKGCCGRFCYFVTEAVF
jgi:epoxyqueuosine reductase QueG